jgi:ParB family transcriptional regulator, chromosome partitioning protein
MKTRAIPIARIDPNPDQPRKRFEPAALAELADSIRVNGLLQPITVRPRGRRFEIVAGERRWRAHGLLVKQGHKRFAEITCNVVAMDDGERDIAAIIENLQREDIAPIEEANAFKRLVDRGMTAEDIAKATGAALFRVRWRLQLLNLSPAILALFEAAQLDRQQAMEIARLPGHGDQARILRLINAGKLVGWKSVRNAVDAIMTQATQADIFGDLAPKPTKADAKLVANMEQRIAQVIEMVGRGWRDGECIICARVNLDRAGKIADQLAALQSTFRVMERELRNVTAQGQIVLTQRENA